MRWNPHKFQFTHFHLEISSKCALKCPRCPRTEEPETPWLNKQLSLENIRQILPDYILKDSVKRITICGDVGDPIYNTDFHAIIRYLKGVAPDIHLYIITNGSFRSRKWWSETASILNEKDTVAFSVDGDDDETNLKYRVGSDWKSIAIGMEEIAKSPAFMVWATIVFKFNETRLESIRELARTRGCDYLQITKSTKFGSKYSRFKLLDGSDPLEPESKWISASHRFERTNYNLSGRTIDNSNFLTTMRNNLQTVEKDFESSDILPLCKTANRGLYINVIGQLYPCSWVSFPYKFIQSISSGRRVEFQDSFFHKHKDAFNLLKRDFKEVVSDPLWTKIFGSFDNKMKKFIECEQKCSKVFMDSDYQVGWFLN